MSLPWFVALRFLREGRAQTILILAGVSVGVGVIVFLSALIDGLQTSLVKQTLGSQAHVVLRPPEEVPRMLDGGDGALAMARVEKSPQRLRTIDQWPRILARIRATPQVVAASPTVGGAAFAERGQAQRAVTLRGIDPDSYDRVVSVRERMRAGRFRPEGTSVAIGVELAADLGVGVGDKLRVVTSDGRGEVFTVTGLFDFGVKEINQRWVMASLRAAQTLLDLPGGISAIEVVGEEVFGADALAIELAGRTGLVADSWMRINAQLLVGLRSQDSSRYMIEFFIVLAVALGIASVLAVSVVQKSREIGILRAFGTSRRQITRIFLIQGGLVGLLGSVGGGALGAVLSLFFASMAQNPDGSPKFPVDLNPRLFLGAALVALTTGLLGAVLPARRAARLDPAVVIRYG